MYASLYSPTGLLLLYALKFLLRMYISRFRILPTGYSNII